MTSKFYKNCAVPLCESTTIKTPKKLFIHVPRTENARKKWLLLARRNPELTVTHSKMYFCEDHFDLLNDMENYTEYRVMGAVSQIRMRAGCLPSKFECQHDRKGIEIRTTQSLPTTRQRLETIKEYEREIKLTHSTQSISTAEFHPGPSSDVLQPVYEPITTDKSIQVNIHCKYKSISTQTQKTYRKLQFHQGKS